MQCHVIYNFYIHEVSYFQYFIILMMNQPHSYNKQVLTTTVEGVSPSYNSDTMIDSSNAINGLL